MAVQLEDIHLSGIYDEVLTASLHYLEHPKLKKRAARKGDVVLDYRDALVIQKELVLGHLQKENPNTILLSAVLGEKTIAGELRELAVVDRPLKRFLPRKKDEKWNERVLALDELIGADFYERPQFERTERDFYLPSQLFSRNYLPNTLNRDGYLDIKNPLNCTVLFNLINFGIGIYPDIHYETFPLITSLGLLGGTLVGGGVGFATFSSKRKTPPYSEALYLDFKLSELGLRGLSFEESQMPYKREPVAIPDATSYDLSKIYKYQRPCQRKGNLN